MRRVDRRMNALQTNRPTDRPTDQPTDTASYRGALSHLKTIQLLVEKKKEGNKEKKSFLSQLFRCDKAPL